MKTKITLLAAMMLAIVSNIFALDVIKIGFGPKGAPTTGFNIMGTTGVNPIVVNTPQALTDSAGAATVITFTQTTAVAFQQGAPNPATDQTVFTYNIPAISKYFPANICYTWCYNFNASTTFELAGFSTSDVVELNILSSRGANGATPYTTSRLCSFTATGTGTPVVVSNYEPGGNYSNIATIAGLKPDINGKITLTVASATGATLMNAMRIARVAGTATSVSNPNESSKMTAFYNNGRLIVGIYNGVVRLFDITGKKLAESQAISGAINVNLQKGIYIVETSAGTSKIAVN
jgi:hypothetical protein